ncbi:MAG: cobalamin-dependent protein, partial [Bacteroidota bacterium]
MKILLIAPCPVNEQRHNTMDIPQLTLSLIAGMTPPEHEVEICEEVYGQMINYDGDYDLVGITLMTQTCIRGYEVANEFRKRGTKVVFGGIHATAMPKEAILFADAVVIGEAEDGLWENVLNDAKNNRLKQFYKLDKMPDLQNHVYPRRDLIRCASGKFSIAPIETTRGCPYNCNFCSVSRFFGTKQRHKPIRDIIQEAEMCEEKILFFLDDNITLDKKFIKKLFLELIPLKKAWVGQASINL